LQVDAYEYANLALLKTKQGRWYQFGGVRRSFQGFCIARDTESDTWIFAVDAIMDLDTLQLFDS